ncbi:MAG: Hsp70 family protein [Armatimonadetes bacterium]|nr:Hsp70 family protein [Armatimonadota bacterium]
MANFVGIDFGTTNSVVANLVEEPTRVDVQIVLNNLGSDRTPSAVAIGQRAEWLFGQAAKEANTRDKILSVKRILGTDQTVSLAGRALRTEFIATLLFRHLITESQRRLGEGVEAAVVTVPANSKGLQRNATKLSAHAAGVRVLNLINEPTAAAMAYGLGRSSAGRDLRVLVYDFGGGTFDVTVLRAHHGIFEEIASRGLKRCGGDDLDAALADYLRQSVLVGHDQALAQPYPDLRLRLACEDCKIALSTAGTARVDIEDLLPSVSVHEELERDTFEGLVRPIVERTGEPVMEALQSAGLQSSDIDHVLLVGGTSRVPLVRNYVENLLGRPAEPFGEIDPMTCVAQGAAIVSGILQGAEHMEEYDYQVCLEHSLCTDPVDVMTGRKYLEPLIGHGTKIPSQNTSVYLPVVDNAREVVVNIYEGNVYDDPQSEENVRIGQVRVPLDPPRPAEQCPIEVQFEYSEEGIITARAKDLRMDRGYASVIDYSTGHLQDNEQQALRELVTQVFGEAPPVPIAAPRPEPEPVAAATAAAGLPVLTDDMPAEVREAVSRVQKADKVLAELGNDAEAGQLRSLRNRLADALQGVTPVNEVVALDQQLAAELMFFDYLL